MKDFLFVFRADVKQMGQPSPEQMHALAKRWMDWFGSIAAQNKLVDRGSRLLPNVGKVVKADNLITDGPYVEIKEAVGGFAIVKVNSIEEATEIAQSCPVLNYGGSVEVREIMKQ